MTIIKRVNKGKRSKYSELIILCSLQAGVHWQTCLNRHPVLLHTD